MPKLGALSTLLVFAVAMSNVAFGEKIYSEHSVKKGCPYDMMSMFDLSEEQGASMKEGREIIEQYSPITEQIDYQLYSPGETTLCSSIPGYVEMGWWENMFLGGEQNLLPGFCPAGVDVLCGS
ncbi:MAG: hypothetical protein SOZ82_06430 [Eubacteriales bacterium]|nr:hypothetical protein [Eubacteriales bacterium]